MNDDCHETPGDANHAPHSPNDAAAPSDAASPSDTASEEAAGDGEEIIIASLAATGSTASRMSAAADESETRGPYRSVAEAALPQEPSIRVGSPFATEPQPSPQTARGEEIYFQATPLRYTAMGAVVAATMVVIFAAAATLWFPVGGTMIAGLGCLLSILGLHSDLRVPAAGLLGVHLILFVTNYSRAFA
ncbi:MAG: hypothetical protein ACF788_13545 [Novipirellula sp. JB048]